MYVCPPWHCTLPGSLEHQAWPGPCGKSTCLHLDTPASSCSAPCAAEAGRPLLLAAVAAGAGALALAWSGMHAVIFVVYFLTAPVTEFVSDLLQNLIYFLYGLDALVLCILPHRTRRRIRLRLVAELVLLPLRPGRDGFHCRLRSPLRALHAGCVTVRARPFGLQYRFLQSPPGRRRHTHYKKK